MVTLVGTVLGNCHSYRAGSGMLCPTSISLAGWKPYCHFFSEKYHTGMSQCHYVSQCIPDYLSREHDFQLRMC